MLVAEIIYYSGFVVLIGISITGLIKTRKLRKRYSAQFDKIIKDSENRLSDTKENSKQLEIIDKRINLIAKENTKLREQNEELKERLRNMGITYFD